MRLYFFLMCFGFSSVAFLNTPKSSDSSEKNGVDQGIGVGGTVFDTWGFTYRHHFLSGFGIVGNIGGWLTSRQGHVGLALGPTYTVAHHTFPTSALPQSSIRIYFEAYGSFIVRHSNNIESHRNIDVDRSIYSLSIGLGAGPGAEYFFTRNFSLHLELPWMTILRVEPKGLVFEGSYPHIGGGLTYYF